MYYNEFFWFNCNKCTHEFKSQLSSISALNSWCPYCSNKKLCNNKKCLDCFKKSFGSHKRSIDWSKKNKITPNEVFMNTHKKFWFTRNKCMHEFKLAPKSINIETQWCPYYVN